MPRRQPASAKQRKAQLQGRRALKRGDIDLLSVKPKPSRRGPNTPFTAESSSRRLQSRFISVSPDYLDLTRDLAHNTRLPRPIPASSAEFPIDILVGQDAVRKLSCPGRPKFRVGATKKEVEGNEEGWFRKWLEGMEEVMRNWVEGEDSKEDDVEGPEGGQEEGSSRWPRSTSWFETNLEVWRQLWRVTESSSIILLLLDSRCPPLHAPPSLRSYIQSLKPRKEVILVLTKADLVHPEALSKWKEWIVGWWGGEGVQVVSVMSYDLELLREGKAKHKPAIPDGAMDELIEALRMAHYRLLIPPPRIRDDPERMKSWRPAVRRQIDWSVLARHKLQIQSLSSSTDPKPDFAEAAVRNGSDERRDPELEPLTIGLVGQPNVGKSSLLNALLGEQRVRASRTPGKTKHFQTMFWGWKKDVKVVDCPGLVCPSLVGLEIQALAGILPISQIPSLPACIHYAATVLPLETIFRVPPPTSADTDSSADKRTWRDPLRAEAAQAEKARNAGWTAGGIMEARALDRGYLTAKGGRPDGNRAANAMMRALTDGRVRWGFWPPGSADREGVGIWLEGTGIEDADEDEEEDEKDQGSEGRDGRDDSDKDATSEEEEVEEDEAEKGKAVEGKEEKAVVKPSVGGFFAALEMDSGEEDVSEEEADEEHEGQHEEQ